MKKFVSLLLVAVLCIAVLPLQAFAAVSDEHVDEPKGHTHVFILENTTTKPNGYVLHDDATHKLRYKNECKCSYCSYVYTWYTYGAHFDHDKVHDIDAASCDGTWQKHYGTCSTCGGYGYKRVKCPAGPHTGGCPYLPV